MGAERFRFECNDLADCDVVIYSEFRDSILEAARSHMKDVHGLDLTDDELAPYITEV